MDWIYGRQVARFVLAGNVQRRPRRVVATPGAARALGLAKSAEGVRLELTDAGALDRLTGSREHQGVALAVDPYRYAAPEALLGGDLVVVLDQVNDPRNLGAVARSALAVGAGGLAIPRHRAAAVTAAAVKAAAGATERLPIAQVTNVVAFLKLAKAAGYWVYGASGGASLSYLDLDLSGKVVLVFGSEGSGLRRLAAETCDTLAQLPMEAGLDSLNVSVAAAVFLYEARRQRLRAATT